MFARNGFSLAFLLVSVGILLVIAPARTEESTERNCSNNSSGLSGLDGFLHKVKCVLKNAGEQIDKTVKDGYNYVKKKVTPNNGQTTPQPEIDLRSDLPREPVKLAELPKRR